MVTLNPNACELRPDLLQRFRYYNPNCRLLFYHQLTNWHLDSSFVLNPKDTTFYGEQQRATNWAHGWLPGAPAYSGFPLDWKQADLADTLTRLWVGLSRRTRPDGWFFDYLNVIGTGSYGITPDDDQSRLYHTRRLVAALQADGMLVYGNGGPYGQDRVPLDGGMLEGFPSSLTSFEMAIKQEPGDWLKSESPVGTTGNARLARYTLGVACLTGAWSEHGTSHYYGTPEQGTWWFPEYAVSPTGKPDPTGRYTGWLGYPKGATSRLTPTGWLAKFDHGVVVVNTGSSTWNAPLGGTYKRIGSTSGVTTVSVPAMDAVFLWSD
jgi:hypothetical protein